MEALAVLLGWGKTFKYFETMDQVGSNFKKSVLFFGFGCRARGILRPLGLNFSFPNSLKRFRYDGLANFICLLAHVLQIDSVAVSIVRYLSGSQ